MSWLIDYVWDKENIGRSIPLISVILIHRHTVSSGTEIAELQNRTILINEKAKAIKLGYSYSFNLVTGVFKVTRNHLQGRQWVSLLPFL